MTIPSSDSGHVPFPQLETQSASKDYAAYFDLEDRLRNYRVSLRGSNVEIFPAKEAPSSDSKCVGKQRVGIGSRVFPNFLAVSWFFWPGRVGCVYDGRMGTS
ncbi:Autophagy-related protein 28 [Fusarium oxysporum f. sp. albedinis]|nr:Autophagy-related protein 28 [Fusarium oxysporum f. sp. albedinis]